MGCRNHWTPPILELWQMPTLDWLDREQAMRRADEVP